MYLTSPSSLSQRLLGTMVGVLNASLGVILGSNVNLVLLSLRTLVRCSAVVSFQPDPKPGSSVWCWLELHVSGNMLASNHQCLSMRDLLARMQLASLLTIEAHAPVQMSPRNCSWVGQTFRQEWNLKAQADSPNCHGWVKTQKHTHTRTYQEVSRARRESWKDQIKSAGGHRPWVSELSKRKTCLSLAYYWKDLKELKIIEGLVWYIGCWIERRGSWVGKLALGRHRFFFFFWSRGLWPLDQTHLTVSNWANQETIFPFPFFVRVEGWGLRRLLSLVGRNTLPEAEKG